MCGDGGFRQADQDTMYEKGNPTARRDWLVLFPREAGMPSTCVRAVWECVREPSAWSAGCNLRTWFWAIACTVPVWYGMRWVGGGNEVPPDRSHVGEQITDPPRLAKTQPLTASRMRHYNGLPRGLGDLRPRKASPPARIRMYGCMDGCTVCMVCMYPK